MNTITITHEERTAAQQEKNPLYAAGRIDGMRQGEISTTVRILRTLMRTQHMTLEEAMLALELPRKERRIYVKIFGKSQK